MKNILVMGASGQIGSELVPALRRIYGDSRVVASDIKPGVWAGMSDCGPFEPLDCRNIEKIGEIAGKYGIDTIINLVAVLSAVGESNPQLAWEINMGGLLNILEVARRRRCAVFTPSSIAAFGPTTPRKGTPQLTIQRPASMYGVTKVAGELLSDYYHAKYGVDARSVRYPGIISNVTLPGGGTTDYAVHIYYEAIRKGRYCCFLRAGTRLDMMYMPDAIRAAIELMEADPSRLRHRNAYNVAAMSFDPEEIAAEIRKRIPGFIIEYKVDPVRQAIADSWPESMDDTAAREDWGWRHEYDLARMTEDMLGKLGAKLAAEKEL